MTTQLVIIVVYLLAMLGVGILTKMRTVNADDFFVAGRRSSTLFVAGSLVATIIGASATLGAAGLGFRQGLTGAWWTLVGSIGLIILGLFLAKKVRRFAVYTLPELIGKQYDRRMTLASSILIVISWLGITAAQILAAGKIMGILGIGSPALWMVIFTFVFVTYTVLGGQRADITTDLVQAVIICIGVFGGLAVLLSRLGGFSGLQAALPADMFAFPVSSKFGTVQLLSLLLLVGLTYVVGPDMYSRLFCAKDEKTARSSALWAAIIVAPVAVAVALIGMGAAALFPTIAPEAALPTVISQVLSPLLSGLVLAALMSAVMSSADSTLLSASTIVMVDIVGWFKPSITQDRVLPRTRWLIVVLGILSLLIALRIGGIINSLLFAYTIYTSGIILPVLFGFFKDRLKLTSTGALVALVGGGGVGLVSKIWAIKYLDLGALLLSGVLLFVVSWITGRKKI